MSSKRVASSTVAFGLYTCIKASIAQSKLQAMEDPVSHERVITRMLGTISEDCIDKFHPSCFVASGNILSISAPHLTSIILFVAWIPCTSLPCGATLLSYCASYCNEYLICIVYYCFCLSIFLYPTVQ